MFNRLSARCTKPMKPMKPKPKSAFIYLILPYLLLLLLIVSRTKINPRCNIDPGNGLFCALFLLRIYLTDLILKRAYAEAKKFWEVKI